MHRGSSGPERAALGYRPGLDAVRALGIALVVYSHLPRVPWLPASSGAAGVVVFFVVSGFLVTRLLLDELQAHGRIDVLGFWRRRAARLLPAAMLVVAVVTVLDPDPVRAVLATVYVANWVQATNHSIAPLGHYWSLAIEEQFYILWPLLLVFLVRPRLLIAIAVAVAVWRALQVDPMRAAYSTDTRLDALLIGAVIAMVPTVRVPRPGWIAAVAVILATDFVTWPLLGLNSIVLTTLATAVLVWAALELQPPRVLIAIGVISYGIYLVHPPLIAALGWAGLALTIPVAAAMFVAWERPMRRRLAGRRSPAATAPLAAPLAPALATTGALDAAG